MWLTFAATVVRTTLVDLLLCPFGMAKKVKPRGDLVKKRSTRRYSLDMSSAHPPVTVPAGIVVGPLGFVLKDGSEGRSIWEYTVDPSHFNLNGTLHGGVVMALLDTAMGFAVVTRVASQGKFNAAAEQSTRFLAPIRAGVITAEASVLKLGKRLAIVEGRATDDAGNVVAVASATHSILP